MTTPKISLRNVVKRGAPLDLTTYGRKIGLLAKTPDEVSAAVRRALDDPQGQSATRRAMARDVFHAPGGSAERVAGVVRHAAGLLDGLPGGVEELSP